MLWNNEFIRNLILHNFGWIKYPKAGVKESETNHYMILEHLKKSELARNLEAMHIQLLEKDHERRRFRSLGKAAGSL